MVYRPSPIINKKSRRKIIITITTPEKHNQITVVDSIMGSGKSTWAVQYMNSHKLENFMYITPFLTEIDRILENTNRDFQQPINRGEGKLSSLNELLACQTDVASTHELFKHLDDESKDAIKDGHYTLILDEVLNVIEPYNVRANDLQLLQDSGCVKIGKDGVVQWNESKKDFDTKYNEIKFLAENKSLLCINQKLLLWRYPPSIFELFDKVYILTYMFEASVLKYYFDLYKIQYEKKSISRIEKDYLMVDYFVPNTSQFWSKINMYQGDYNENFKQKTTGLSKTWFNAQINRQNISRLKRNIYNYFHNVLNAKSDTIMWSTFKDYKSKLKGKGYTNGFVSFNCRATNDYSDRYNLAYVLNVYLNPGITQFFRQQGIEVNEDLYALSELLQWIWRSRIRTGESINIYIPSMRMRQLLENWLNMSLNYNNELVA